MSKQDSINPLFSIEKLKYLLSTELKECRLRLGFSQIEMAEYLEVSQSQISNLERQSSSLDTLFSAYFKCGNSLKDLSFHMLGLEPVDMKETQMLLRQFEFGNRKWKFEEDMTLSMKEDTEGWICTSSSLNLECHGPTLPEAFQQFLYQLTHCWDNIATVSDAWLDKEAQILKQQLLGLNLFIEDM